MSRPFKADVVGSLLRPQSLKDARAKRQKGEISADALRAAEDAAISDVIKLQESAGLQSITDGEFRRSSWFRYFLLGFDNVKVAEGKLELFFKNSDGTLTTNKPNSMAVTGKIARSHQIQVEDFKFIKANTKVMAKVCIPSPTLMHFRGGRENIDQKAYPQMKDFFADVAKAYQTEINDMVANGLKYIQIDDTNLAYLCDEKMREAARARGDDPNELPHRYAAFINKVVAQKPAGMTLAMHLCRGNFKSTHAAAGNYEPVAEALLSEMNIDAYFLEYDDDRSGDFRPLRFLAKDKLVVLGLVTTKFGTMESKDALKRRIDEAAKYVPKENLRLSPQCGFASTHHGNKLTQDDQRAKLRLCVEVADEVWG